jgi:thioredoxin reductase (NADPH)
VVLEGHVAMLDGTGDAARVVAVHGPGRFLSMLVELGAGFRIIGSRYSPDTRRLREFAVRNRLPHRWIDLERDREAEALLRRLGVPPEETPVAIWRGRQVLRNPSNAELARAIGLPAPGPGMDRFDLVIGDVPARPGWPPPSTPPPRG